MGLESDILSDLRQLLTEHGVSARWQGLDLLVLVSRIRREQQMEMGGFVESPDLSLRVPKDGTPEFTAAIMGFVFAHCTPWPEVVRASFDNQTFRESALIFCGGLTPADFQTAFKRLEEQSKELEAAQVGTMGGVGAKKPRRATNPAS